MAMFSAQGLDPELLQAFQLIAEGQSFTQAADQLGRTQSAVSMQIKRLEEILGKSVLSRGKGGGITLTPHGRYLLGPARQILALNDEVMTTFRAPTISGTVRLGTPDDYALSHIPGVLRRFAETHPAVQLKAGELDLTLVSDGNQPRNWPAVPLWRGPLTWITSARYAPHRQDPLPLALAHENCGWRASAQAALDTAGIRYRIAYLSGTQIGTHAPVVAGLAVTVSALTVLPEGVRAMRPDEGLPRLPEFGIVMLKGRKAAQPVTDALAAHIEERFRLDFVSAAA
jgi:DNA-binding transcriptional LysR family regulator